MSGIEVAGLVLGAFPLCIAALEQYRQVATRLGLFYQIRLEYKKVLDNLKIHQLTFKRHLRQLLLPLLVDDDKMATLLADPGGPSWKEQAVADLLQDRLQESFPLYMDCIQGLQRVMEDMNRELAMDSDAVLDKVNSDRASTPGARFKSAMNQEGRVFQRYRLKFSNGESVRKRLFEELKNHNDNLEKLLDSSDRDAQLVQTRLTTLRAAAIDATICKFWIQARKVWTALSTALSCQCPQHEAKLLLEHRTVKKFEVQIMFTTLSTSSQWEICRTRISQDDDAMGASIHQSLSSGESLPIRLLKPGGAPPLKSALKGKRSTPTSVPPVKPFPSITFTKEQKPPRLDVSQQITNLCAALAQQEGSCCGYLPEPDHRYYVYTIHRQRAEAVPSVSLAQILRGDVQPQPTRTQRYIISLILASSFLQLLESPWMPTSFKETDISFLSDPDNPNVFILDQPHITRDLPTATVGTRPPQETASFTDALDHLGIILLELCFGRTLEEQPCRKKWPSGGNDMEKGVYDVMAARDWQRQVNEEAGLDYAEAVGWCLGGNRSAVPERWRQDMLHKVIEPLQRCRDYLTASGAGVGGLVR